MSARHDVGAAIVVAAACGTGNADKARNSDMHQSDTRRPCGFAIMVHLALRRPSEADSQQGVR